MAKYDDYMTPKKVWEDIKHLIPKGKTIWEPFYGDGQSGRDLAEITKQKVEHVKHLDFFDVVGVGDDTIMITNPPYSKSQPILKHLKTKFPDLPWIMILPAPKICTQYFREHFKGDVQIIIPKKRIHFKKLVDGNVPQGWKEACPFDCFYVCHKMNLENDITWLEN